MSFLQGRERLIASSLKIYLYQVKHNNNHVLFFNMLYIYVTKRLCHHECVNNISIMFFNVTDSCFREHFFQIIIFWLLKQKKSRSTDYMLL